MKSNCVEVITSKQSDPQHGHMCHFIQFILYEITRLFLLLRPVFLPQHCSYEVLVSFKLFQAFNMLLLLLLTSFFTLREPNIYKPHAFFLFFLDFLAPFICSCVTALFLALFDYLLNRIFNGVPVQFGPYSLRVVI